MRNSLLNKFHGILDTIYSSKLKHSEEVEKELGELSQILEMPMDNLMNAIGTL